MTQNEKKTKNANECFCTKSQKKTEMEIFAFCVITFEPLQNDYLNLNFVKDDHTYGQKLARNGCKMSINESVLFLNRVYVFHM